MVSRVTFRGRVVCFFSHKKNYSLGCPTCYDRCTVNPINGKTMQDLYEDTLSKVCYLKEQGLNIVEMWECDLKKKLENDDGMRCYFEGHSLIDPLAPRDAFFGGRTNAAKLFYECKDQEKIRLVIITVQKLLRISCYVQKVVTLKVVTY